MLSRVRLEVKRTCSGGPILPLERETYTCIDSLFQSDHEIDGEPLHLTYKSPYLNTQLSKRMPLEPLMKTLDSETPQCSKLSPRNVTPVEPNTYKFS